MELLSFERNNVGFLFASLVQQLRDMNYGVAVDVRMRVSVKCSSIPFPWMSVNTCQMTDLSDTQQLIRLIVSTFRSEDKRYDLLNEHLVSQVILRRKDLRDPKKAHSPS